MRRRTLLLGICVGFGCVPGWVPATKHAPRAPWFQMFPEAPEAVSGSSGRPSFQVSHSSGGPWAHWAPGVPWGSWGLLLGVVFLMLAQPVDARVFSVGDLHGDYQSCMQILRSLGLMGKTGEWVGGDSILVQTGDILDRGNESGPILKQVFRLQDEAPASGGKVILLMGNHELMNFQGDFRYGSEAETRSLAGLAAEREADGPDLRAAPARGPMRARIFSGWLGSELRSRLRSAVLLGAAEGLSEPVLFVHGGLELPRAPEALNAELRRWFDGGEAEWLVGQQGPFWSRKWALGAGSCGELQEILTSLGAKRMVVGHTAQADGRVHDRCNGRLILGDSLISRFYTGTAHPWAVEFLPDGSVEAIDVSRGERVPLPNL